MKIIIIIIILISSMEYVVMQSLNTIQPAVSEIALNPNQP